MYPGLGSSILASQKAVLEKELRQRIAHTSPPLKVSYPAPGMPPVAHNAVSAIPYTYGLVCPTITGSVVSPELQLDPRIRHHSSSQSDLSSTLSESPFHSESPSTPENSQQSIFYHYAR